MVTHYETILVFGGTGQQGGAVAHALRAKGWPVRALVRDINSDKAKALAAAGVQLFAGNLADTRAIEAAMAGAYGVFSVQPSSGQGPAHGVTDQDEILYGKTIADIAAAQDVRHFVYSSSNAAGPAKTGMGHFDTKREIEAHIRSLDIPSTIIRPSAFMEILMLPGMGLDRGTFSFFMQPDRPMQFIAVEDIGRITAGIFADPAALIGKTMEIAGDTVTGNQLADKFSHAAGRSISYHRFPESLLAENAFLGGLARLVDDGRLAGHADINKLHKQFPGLLSMDQWLAGAGKPLLLAAIQSQAAGVALR